MADVTKCAICQKPYDAPVHSEVGGHQFKRIEVFAPVKRPSSWSVWKFLGICALVAALAVAAATAF